MIYNIILKNHIKFFTQFDLNKLSNQIWIIENTNIIFENIYFSLELIKKYSYKWYYFELSFNKNLTEEFILKYPYKYWDIPVLIKKNKITNFNVLSKFKHIEHYIWNYPDKQWDWEWLIQNTDYNIEYYIPLDLIEKYKYKLTYKILSENSNITEEFILEYPYQHWDIIYLIENNKITDFNTLSKFKYIDQEIIKKYPNKPWNWDWLIQNTDINLEEYIPFNLIEKYPYKWNYRILSFNPNLTEEFILKYPYKNWIIEYLIENNKITDFKALSKFKNINQYILDNYPNKSWDRKWINKNLNYTYNYNLNFKEEFILKNSNKYWDIIYLIKNNKITDFKTLTKFKYINQYIIEFYPNKPWDWEWLIENTDINVEEYIPLNLIEKYQYTLNYNYLSKNPNIIKEFILKYPYKNWDIDYLIKINKITDFNILSKFINISKYIIDNYPNKPWDWEWLIENTDINVEEHIPLNLIKKYQYTLNYKYLSKNSNLTEDFILKQPYQNWDIEYLIKNNKIIDFNTLTKFRNINNKLINNYPNKPWDWEWLIENTEISLEEYISMNLIKKYKGKWNYWYLSKNPNITEEYILNHFHKKWDIKYLINTNKKFKKIFYKISV